MNKITITLPKGAKATDIVERGEGDDYFVDINYIEDSEMCKIRQPHTGFDCKCNKPELPENNCKHSRANGLDNYCRDCGDVIKS